MQFAAQKKRTSRAHDLLLVLTTRSGPPKMIRKYFKPSFYDSQEYAMPSDQVFRNMLSQLKKRGLIENTNSIWSITQKGKDFVTTYLYPHAQKRNDYLKNRHRKKNMIIAFDIPEKYRKKRDWLRIELISLGFVQLQKSVWFGPSPLPNKFMEDLKELNMFAFMKFFEAKESDIV